ncbi:MAG: hypothetical protein ACLVJ6_03205 [Merdibacter sp.]
MRQINLLPIHINAGYQLARRYANSPSAVVAREYVGLVVRQLELLRPEIIIHG